MLLRGGGLEALRLVDREVAGQPHESVPALRGIAHGGVVRVVLRFEQLLAEAGQVLRGGLELRAALRKTALTVGDLLPVFVKALFRRDELAGGTGGGQRTEDGDGLLLPDRREPEEGTSSSASSEARSFLSTRQKCSSKPCAFNSLISAGGSCPSRRACRTR